MTKRSVKTVSIVGLLVDLILLKSQVCFLGILASSAGDIDVDQAIVAKEGA